ncbi:unnamed protein product [Schistosoma haematobium]|nr:unnamed protein product [Schistosoma haematobium]
MSNPEMPYFPQANYSRNSIPNTNWNDFSHKSPLKQQHLLNNNEGTPEANRGLTQSTTDLHQYPVYPNTLNCMEGRNSNQSFQNSTPSSGLFTIPSGTQNQQLNCSVPQLVSATPPDYGINGLPVTTNNTNLAYIPTTRPTSGFLHPPRPYETNPHLQSFPTTNTISNSSFHASSYSDFNASNQYNPSVYSPLHSPTMENNQAYTSQGGSTSVCDYTGYSQPSNFEYRSSVPLNSGGHPTSEFTNMQAVSQVYGEQQQHSSLNPQFDKPSPVLPTNPRTLTPGQNVLPSTTAYNMDPSVKSPSLYPPHVTNEVHAISNSVGSYGMTPPLPPVPMMTNNTTHQSHPQPPLPRPGNTLQPATPRHTAYEQSGVFRTPGTVASVSDWNSLKTPINLLQERCLLPSDGPDLPPKPALTTPINCDQDVMRWETMRMLICPDLEEIFLPDDEGLINRVEDSADSLRDFLLHLPENFIGTNDTGNCLGSALQAALKLIGAVGGRITVFTTCLPTVGSGALSLREEPCDRSSVDVKHLGPSTDFYKTYALDCSHKQVGVDMFIFNSQYCDIATISGASRYSSGTVHHYPDFYYTPDEDEHIFHTDGKTNVTSDDCNKQQKNVCVGVEQFRRDFDRYLTRKLGFEAVMRIRCTQGLAIQTFHGSCFVRSTDLIALPNVSPDSGYAVQLDLSESLEKCATVCCQAAVLYTSSKGDRRIRVHTLCLPVVHTATEVFQGADQGAIACLLSKMAVDRTISSGLSNAREALANAVADALSAYATTSGITLNSNSTAYGLPCPPNLRLLPLYICGLLRFKAFRVGVTTRLDDRSAALERIKTAPPTDLLTLIYPKLYAVHRFVSKPLSSHTTLAQKAASLRLVDHDDDQRPSDCDGTSSSNGSESNSEADQLPCQLHLSAQYITRSGVFLLDTGELLLLLVGCGEDVSPGSNNDSDILRQLLGISSPRQLPAQGGPFILPPINLSNEKQNTITNDNTSIPIGRRRLSALINLIRRRRPINNALVLMRHDSSSNLRSLFLSCMVEDKTESAPSYQEFLQMIQNLVRT